MLNGVKLNQDYIHAYRLLQEVVNIKNMPDTLERAIALQRWGDKATAFVNNVNPPCSVPLLSLVQEEHHQTQQNCDDVSQPA